MVSVTNEVSGMNWFTNTPIGFCENRGFFITSPLGSLYRIGSFYYTKCIHFDFVNLS